MNREPKGRLTWLERLHRRLVQWILRWAEGVEPAAWRCFHCGRLFTDAGEAAAHFGPRADARPAACEGMLIAYAEAFERAGVHRNFHNAASVKILARQRDDMLREAGELRSLLTSVLAVSRRHRAGRGDAAFESAELRRVAEFIDERLREAAATGGATAGPGTGVPGSDAGGPDLDGSRFTVHGSRKEGHA